MERRLLGFFSGFPSRRFPRSVAGRLARGMACRESLVFVSAWPEDYRRNDSDSAGMYEMFLEYDMDFSQSALFLPKTCFSSQKNHWRKRNVKKLLMK